MSPRTRAATEERWHDGHLSYPRLSGDGRRYHDGHTWHPVAPVWHSILVLSLILLGASVLAWPLGFAYIAAEPAYPGQADPALEQLAVWSMLLGPPSMLLLLGLSLHRLGRGSFHGGRWRGAGWHWEAPSHWPSPPRGWLPEPGWVPDPQWGPAPQDWDGWKRRSLRSQK